jgi:hypothetical protein
MNKMSQDEIEPFNSTLTNQNINHPTTTSHANKLMSLQKITHIHFESHIITSSDIIIISHKYKHKSRLVLGR